jgi:single-stranded-DNA-specific exonuclease
MQTSWTLKKPDPATVTGLGRAIGCHPVTARVLVNRGIATPRQAEAFLSPSLADLRPPDRIRDMEAAAGRLCRAVRAGEPILVFGDYDADGVSAAALLCDFLHRCGARVGVYLPHRLREGYGLQAEQIRRIARSRQFRLIVTVDCGSSSHAALSEAAASGLEVIVTDHHRISEPLPAAEAVINPCRPDCPSELDLLAGVGVCFYLVIALRQRLREAGFWSTRPEPNLRDYCDLVALGTVADMVPLQAENRVLVRAGLSVLGSGCRPGMSQLMAVAGVNGSDVVAESLAYRLAPRINAAGRMAHAIAAFRLLSTTDKGAAGRIARLLDRLNRRRQIIEAQMIDEAREMLDTAPALARRRTVVLSRPDWPEGVLGIAASRMVRRLNRPVVLISTRNGRGKGSARSIPGIDLYKVLLEMEDCLDRFGGHAMAAGVTVSADRIDAFSERLEETVARQADADSFQRSLSIDAELPLSEVSESLMEELERIGPFGEGNPEPLLMTRSVQIVSTQPVGADHLRMTVRQEGHGNSQALEAIRFGAGQRPPDSPVQRMAFRLRWNRWKGRKRLQLTVAAVDDGSR